MFLEGQLAGPDGRPDGGIPGPAPPPPRAPGRTIAVPGPWPVPAPTPAPPPPRLFPHWTELLTIDALPLAGDFFACGRPITTVVLKIIHDVL